MKNQTPSSMGGKPEHNERGGNRQHTGVEKTVVGNRQEQVFLDYLLEMDFTWEEAQKLIQLRENLCENSEMRQRMADDCRMQFARWLYEQGEIKEA
ncbi:MAG TPA: hypothetical protein VFA09_01565 [Ktedonobacteraceae bacterium]|jgi:hypothetical protein|nr:hypothetical protein [Ktedonobacteraceae bacterium]